MLNYLVACWVIMFHSPIPVDGLFVFGVDSAGVGVSIAFCLHSNL